MFPAISENRVPCTRRHWLKVAGALTIGTTLARSLQAAAEAGAPAAAPQPVAGHEPGKEPSPLIQIGILLGTFSRPTLEARLDAVKACGLDCVQLSMDCAGLPLMPDKIAPETICQRIRREAAARAIEIASLQGTFNMSHPDAEHRRAGVRRLGVLAAACQQLGTSKIHICTGTRDPRNMWRRHPDNDSPEAWRDMVACVRAAVEIARPVRRDLGLRAGGQQRGRFGEEGPAAAGRDRLPAPEGHDGCREPVSRRRIGRT